MSEIKVGLLENFIIKNWYRFVLYLGGVTLILSFFLEPKGITIKELRDFSVWSIGIGLFLWFLERLLNFVVEWKELEVKHYSLSEEEFEKIQKEMALGWFLFQLFVLSFWLLGVLPHVSIS